MSVCPFQKHLPPNPDGPPWNDAKCSPPAVSALLGSPAVLLTALATDPNLPVRIVNDIEEMRTVSLTVTRESGEVVHEAPPGSDQEVYNLRAADPDGVESFEIAAERGDASESVTVQTSECYGHVIVSVDEEGLGVTYSVC